MAQDTLSEPDQKRFIGHVPCPCDYCVRGFQRSFSPPTFPLPLPVWERKGARGKVRGHQACAAAQALKPLKPFSIA
jgi:hypothetical protein